MHGLPRPLLRGSELEGPNGEEASELQQLELHNMDLQAHLVQQSGESARLKITERELRQEVRDMFCHGSNYFTFVKRDTLNTWSARRFIPTVSISYLP